MRNQNQYRQPLKQTRKMMDGLVSPTAGQKSRIIYRPTKAAQTSKIKFLNSDDGKGEDDGKHLNEGSGNKSHSFCNTCFKRNQGIPKSVSSEYLEGARKHPLEKRMKHDYENRASRKMYQHSLSKPLCWMSNNAWIPLSMNARASV